VLVGQAREQEIDAAAALDAEGQTMRGPRSGKSTNSKTEQEEAL